LGHISTGAGLYWRLADHEHTHNTHSHWLVIGWKPPVGIEAERNSKNVSALGRWRRVDRLGFARWWPEWSPRWWLDWLVVS